MVNSPNKHARVNSVEKGDEDNLNPMFVSTDGVPMIKVCMCCSPPSIYISRMYTNLYSHKFSY